MHETDILFWEEPASIRRRIYKNLQAPSAWSVGARLSHTSEKSAEEHKKRKEKSNKLQRTDNGHKENNSGKETEREWSREKGKPTTLEDNPWLSLLPSKEQRQANDIRKKKKRT